MASVGHYLSQFEELMNEVEGQSEHLLISFFTRGIILDLKNELRIRRPDSLWEAFSLAKIYESNQNKSSRVVPKSTTVVGVDRICWN